MKGLKTTFFLTLIIASTNCASQTNEDSLSNKIKGVIFDGPANPPITKEMIENVLPSNAEWIAITPEAFIYKNTLTVRSFWRDGQWYGETLEGGLQTAGFAKKPGFKVMFKPHVAFTWDLSEWDEPKNIDFDNEADREKYFEKQNEYIATLENKTKGHWRGDFEVKNPDDWVIWEKEYEKFILHCAQIADSVQVDLFCVGTELDQAAIQRPRFWRSLIAKVRSVYRGPLTYCANWDNYQHIRFWDDLDDIGISAYFPVSDQKSPSLKEATAGWAPHAEALENFQNIYQKPVLFAELGYKSTEYAGGKPWLEQTENIADHDAQANLYQAAFGTFWRKHWFKGIFIWKWYYAGNGGATSFSPQKKPASEVMRRWYKKH